MVAAYETKQGKIKRNSGFRNTNMTVQILLIETKKGGDETNKFGLS